MRDENVIEWDPDSVSQDPHIASLFRHASVQSRQEFAKLSHYEEVALGKASIYLPAHKTVKQQSSSRGPSIPPSAAERQERQIVASGGGVCACGCCFRLRSYGGPWSIGPNMVGKNC